MSVDSHMMWAEAVRRILFAMVDMVLDSTRREGWDLRGHGRHVWERWANAHSRLGWWRSTWVAA